MGAAVTSPPRRQKLIEHGAFGMALFVFTEIMMFAGFISAFMIVKNTALPGMWPPAGQPRLPVESTALNTLALFASGVALFLAYRAFAKRGAQAAVRLTGVAILLGAVFVLFQGVEWAALLRQGLTMTSSQLGSFFYLIVGAHALHAVAALVALAVYWNRLRTDRLSRSAFAGISLFWYFVVLVWPFIYWKVYL